MAQKRAIGVVRVSATRGREGDSFHSPKTQLERIRAACQGEGAELINHFEELDVSGTRPLEKRPGLSKAVAAIEAGEAELIVVAYFDRLVRSMRVQAEVVERVEKAGGNVLTLDAGQITNGTAATTLQANMLGAVAQYWADQTRDKVKESQARAVALGIPPWPVVPPGYRRGPDKRYVVDEEVAPAIREAFELRAKGRSVNQIRRRLAERGVKRSYAGVKTLLEMPTYVGEIRFGSLVNASAHEPIVDRALFDRVQRMKTPRAHPYTPSERLLAGQGILLCEHCGSRLVLSWNEPRPGKRYAFYRCKNVDCEQRCSISAPLVEGVVMRRVRELVEGFKAAASAETGAVEALAAWDRAEASLTRLLRFYAAAGAEDEAEAIEQIRAAREARNAAKWAHDDALARSRAAKVVVTADDIDAWEPQEKRDLIRAVIEKVEIRRGGEAEKRIDVRARVDK